MSAQAYSYSPLSQARSIRVIVLEPAKKQSAELRCSLVEVGLDDAPQYHALSYVWGLPAAPELMPWIAIRPSLTPQDAGIEATYARLTITPNCAAALRHLRLPKKTRRLWIDAICINQSSNDEKSSQVKMMTEIYFLATRVVFWLDLSDIDDECKSKSAMSFIGRLGSLRDKRLMKVHELDPVRRWRIIGSLVEQYIERRIKSLEDTLAAIASNRYFSRVWTVQELAMARLYDTDVITRHGTMPWRYFWVGVFVYWSSQGPLMVADEDFRDYIQLRLRSHFLSEFGHEFQDAFLDRDIRIGSLWVDASISSFTQVWSLDATLVEDKVYSTMWSYSPEFTAQHPLPFFEVNYSKTRTQIFVEHAVALLSQGVGRFEEFLILAATTRRGGEDAADLPSWAPGWDYTVGATAIDTLASLMEGQRLEQPRNANTAGGAPPERRELTYAFRHLPIPTPRSPVEASGPDSREICVDAVPAVAIITRRFTMPDIPAVAERGDGFMLEVAVKVMAALLDLLLAISEFTLSTTRKGGQSLGDFEEECLAQLYHAACEYATDLSMPPTENEKRLLGRDGEITATNLGVLRIRYLMDLALAIHGPRADHPQQEGDNNHDRHYPGPVESRIEEAPWINRVRQSTAGAYLPSTEALKEIDMRASTKEHPVAFIILSCAHEMRDHVVTLAVVLNVLTGLPGRGTFFLTQCGKIGVAIKAEPGDEVTIWKGVRCPVIIRKAHRTAKEIHGKGKNKEKESEYNQEDKWAMVSPAYIHGMMKGEEFDETKLVKRVIV